MRRMERNAGQCGSDRAAMSLIALHAGAHAGAPLRHCDTMFRNCRMLRRTLLLIPIAFVCNICYTSPMHWLVLTYSLPTGPNSSPRVTLWRRLRRVGAVAVSGGVYLLPTHEPCREAFAWLRQEIREAGGEALVLHVAQIEGLENAEVIELFATARRKDYAELAEQAEVLAAQLTNVQVDQATALDTLARLRRRMHEVQRIDYFAIPEGRQLTAQLDQLDTLLAPVTPSLVVSATLAAYQGQRWATRPRPHVDRLACSWLIRRFIDPHAPIRYTFTPAPDEVTFDMDDATFTHTGSLCTFETMVRAFAFDDPVLPILAALVHAIDLRDGQDRYPEIAGIDRVLDGWLQLEASDAEREQWGIALFEGLYRGFAQRADNR
jgi:hypothetical protein